MKLWVLLIATSLGAFPITAQETERPEAQAIIDAYSMIYLEEESGYFALREESKFDAEIAGKTQKIHSSIYYLLTEKTPINYLHWLASEDIHILVDGGPLDYYLFLEDGSVQKQRLGLNRSRGEVPAITVPARSFKAIKLVEGAKYGLMVNVLTPAWSEDQVQVGVPDGFFKRFEGKESWATLEFLQSLQH